MNNIIPELSNPVNFYLFPYLIEIKKYLLTVCDIHSVYIRGSLAQNIFQQNLSDIDIIILYHKHVPPYINNIKEHVEEIIEKYENNIHLDLLQLSYDEAITVSNIRFCLKTKSIPLLIGRSGFDIRIVIKDYKIKDIPKTNLSNINKFLEIVKYHNTPTLNRHHHFIAKKIIRSLYEKYLDKIKVWIISCKEIFNSLSKIKVFLSDYEACLLSKSSLVLQNKYKFKPNDFNISL